MPATTSIRVKGERYGARPDRRGPIGGGSGYRAYPRTRGVAVSSVDELTAALKRAHPGTVIRLAGTVVIDCTERVYTDQLVFEIPDGVTLAGDRGQKGSPGALIFSDAFATRPLFRVRGNRSRITGLRIRGPDPKRRLEHHRLSFDPKRGDSKVQHEYYYRFPVSEGVQVTGNAVEIDNCELSGWSLSAVYLKGGSGHRVHHCYVHHNQYNGLGYGVCLDRSTARITHNAFNWNRHSIAGTGAPGSEYEASDNVERGVSLSHCFDMHGGADRQDGTDIAGSRIRIHHNTFRAPNPAIVIRGMPQDGVEIHHNWFVRNGMRRRREHPPVIMPGGLQEGANAGGYPPRLSPCPKGAPPAGRERVRAIRPHSRCS